MVLVHECTMVIIHNTCTYYEHGTCICYEHDPCTYYDQRLCMHCGYSASMYHDHRSYMYQVLRGWCCVESRVGGPGGETLGKQEAMRAADSQMVWPSAKKCLHKENLARYPRTVQSALPWTASSEFCCSIIATSGSNGVQDTLPPAFGCGAAFAFGAAFALAAPAGFFMLMPRYLEITILSAKTKPQNCEDHVEECDRSYSTRT